MPQLNASSSEENAFYSYSCSVSTSAESSESLHTKMFSGFILKEMLGTAVVLSHNP